MSKKFIKIFFITISVIIGLIIIIRVGAAISIINSAAFEFAKLKISENEKTLEIIGEIESFGKFPSGGLSTENGIKKAQVETKVFGAKSNAKVILKLEKQKGEDWEVLKFYFKELK